MVFCGKPSQGCLPCRNKKKKCDETRPMCGRCTRTGTVCPGYRDQLSLIFRDESEDVTRKYKRWKSSFQMLEQDEKISEAQDSRAISYTKDGVLSPELWNVGVYNSRLSDPFEQQGISIFFQTFVRTSSDICKGDLEFLPSMHNNAHLDDALPVIITSVGMACLSNLRLAPEIMAAAKAKYTEALRLTNEALEDPTKALTDQTFMAVILLGLFETVTCCSPLSMRSWEDHIKGAVTLLDLRGEDQFLNSIGMEIFLHVRAQITISCLQREVAIPKTVVRWSNKLRNYLTDHDLLSHNLSDILARLCSIKDDIHTRRSAPLSALLKIDRDLQNWVTTIPEIYTYTTVIAEACPEVLSGYYHLYHKPWTAELWNNYRCATILVHDLIIYTHSPLNPPSPIYEQDIIDQLTISQSIMDRYCLEICASVPYYLNFRNCRGPCPDSPDSLSHVADCQSLIWPVYVAASMDSSSDMMRGWAMVQLIKLGRIIGTQHTSVLATLLKSRGEISKWLESE